MPYNALPHAVALLVLFVLIGLFSTWGLATADTPELPPAAMSLLLSIIGIIVSLFAVVNL